MTVAEREAAAVADHNCPKCRAQKRFRCRKVTAHAVSITSKKHPCPERVALVDATAAAQQASCDHDYSITLLLPLKIAGAVTGHTEYKECARCQRRAVASAVTP